MAFLDEWTDEEKAAAIDIVTEAFPREFAMYDAHGCEHPYSKEGLGDAIRLAQFDYMQLLGEVLTEGNIYHNWPKSLTMITTSINVSVKEGINSTIALQRSDPSMPPTLTLRWIERAYPSLGEQVFRRQITKDDKVVRMAKSRVSLHVNNMQPMTGLRPATGKGPLCYRWLIQMDSEAEADQLFSKWTALIDERKDIFQRLKGETETKKRKRQDEEPKKVEKEVVRAGQPMKIELDGDVHMAMGVGGGSQGYPIELDD